MTTPVTIRRPARTTDRYGDEVLDFSTFVDFTDTVAWISQRAASEDLNGRNERRSEWVGFFPVDVCLSAHDRVLWCGRVFEVIGPPNVPETPHGGPHHVEADLRIVEG